MRFKMPEGYAPGPDHSGAFTYLPVPTELSRTMERIQNGQDVPTLEPPAEGDDARRLAASEVENRAGRTDPASTPWCGSSPSSWVRRRSG